MSLLLLLNAPETSESAVTAELLEAASVLDSLVREPAEELYGKKWHNTWAGTGDGTPSGWAQSEGEANATARWWAYGFPGPAFAGLTLAEPLSAGQELRIVLMDDKLGNAVVFKILWNTAEQYFYALVEEVEGEEAETPMATGFVPRAKGDRFYLSVEEGTHGVRAWRETGGGEPAVFAKGTLARTLESAYGTKADLYLLGAGTFRGKDFSAVSLNPEPPIKPKAAGRMFVALDAGGWGAAADVAGAVHMARAESELGPGTFEELIDTGLLIQCVFAGPYEEGGVSALDPDEWVARELAFYEAHLTPANTPIVEVLNEPGGTWFWGPEAESVANALAYRTLVQKTYEAFHARYGKDAPKIIATVQGSSSLQFGEKWWEPACAAYVDGVVIHAYGGNNPEQKTESAKGNRQAIEEARELTGLPVYVTEIGWPTAVEEEPTGDSIQWTEAEQAANIRAFFAWARGTQYVAEIAYFNYRDFGTNTWYGVVDIGGKHKLSYAVLKEQTAIYDRYSRVAITREFPPDRLAVRIADPTTGQTIARWAEDEGKAANLIAGITKSGEMNGGHKESGGSLARDPRVDWPDTQTYFDYFLEQPGGEKVFEGRLNGAPESDGERMVLEPKAVGHQVALGEDRKALRMGFIDGDLSKWGELSTARRERLKEAAIDLVASTSTGFSSRDAKATAAAVINDFTNTENQEGRSEAGEADYDSGGVDIGGVLYDYRQLTGYSKDTDWETNLALGTSDTFISAIAGTDHDRTTALQQEVSAGKGSGYRFARLRDRYTGGGSGPLGDVIAWQNLKVIANHGLPLQGIWPNVGFTSKQILGYAVPRYTYLEANDEDLEDDGYVIQQAWYSDPGELATVVKDVLKYGILRWFVLNGKRFELRAPGTFGRNWQAYAGPSELKEAGEDGSRLWNKLVVSYQDVDGTTKTVGYLGSGADSESAALEITDPDHPAVKADRPREDLLSLNEISTPERALEAGERWLQEGNELSHAGEATLRGYVQDDCAVFRPVSQIQPGDRIRFPDAGSNGTGYREVVAVGYGHDSRTATVNLDAPSDAVQALLERYGASISSLALS